MSDQEHSRPTDEAAAWREHNLFQLRHFQSLTLRQKLEAVEGMADIIRHFSRMRTQGRFFTVR